MKAKFYNNSGVMVWECNTDANYEFNNASKAMQKGAVRGVLIDDKGEELAEMDYQPVALKPAPYKPMRGIFRCLLPLLAVVSLASCHAGKHCPAYAGTKPVSRTAYYQEFLSEGMAGKKDKSGYKFKKRRGVLASLIEW